MSGSIVKPQSSSHWYRKDGSTSHDSDLRDARKEGLYPSVTTIDKAAFPAPQLERWKIEQACIAASNQFRQENETPDQYAKRIYEISLERSKEAADFGTRLHDAIEGHPSAPEDIALLPWFKEFDRWSGRAVKERVSSEKVLLDHDIGVAGRTDAIIIATSGERCVVDYKTQDVRTGKSGKKTPSYYDSWARQLAFYAHADAKETGQFPDIPKCLSLVIDSNLGGVVYEKWWEPDEIRDAYLDFLHGAWIFFHSRNFWPKGKWSVCDLKS